MIWSSFPEHLKPKRDEHDHILESAAEYSRRLVEVMPNFPPAIVEQWFYEHWSDIDDYAWLGLSTLQFSLETWPMEALKSCGIAENEVVCQYRDNYAADHPSPRSIQIAEYFSTTGT